MRLALRQLPNALGRPRRGSPSYFNTGWASEGQPLPAAATSKDGPGGDCGWLRRDTASQAGHLSLQGHVCTTAECCLLQKATRLPSQALAPCMSGKVTQVSLTLGKISKATQWLLHPGSSKLGWDCSLPRYQEIYF